MTRYYGAKCKPYIAALISALHYGINVLVFLTLSQKYHLGVPRKTGTTLNYVQIVYIIYGGTEKNDDGNDDGLLVHRRKIVFEIAVVKTLML